MIPDQALASDDSLAGPDQIFRALADRTRRQVVERLSRGPASVSELAQPFDMKLPSFVQHLAVLEKCQLVRSTKKGRVRIFQLRPRQLRQVENWLSQQRQLWEQRLDQLDDYLLSLHQQETKKESNP